MFGTDDTHKPKLRVIRGGLVTPSGDYIEDVFGSNGYLAQVVRGYRPRPGQIALSRTIDSGIVEKRHVISEGPTGTGKSLAYSVPAAYHAIKSDLTICIVTANKTLQSQIVNKDLTELRNATGWNFSFAVRKGIASYLCKREIERNENDNWDKLKSQDQEMVRKVQRWAATTKDGDRESSPGPSGRIWRAFSTTTDECGSRNCLKYRECFVTKAKEAARNADIVVTNYHLLYRHMSFEGRRRRDAKSRIEAEGGTWSESDYIQKLKTESNGILPFFDVIILDEAHHAVDIARDHLGEDATVKWGSVYRCIAGLHGIDLSNYKKRAESIRRQGMEELEHLWERLETRIKHDLVVFQNPGELDSEFLENLLTDASSLYEEYAKAIKPRLTADQERLLAAGEPAGLTVLQAADMVAHNHALWLSALSVKVRDRISAFRTMRISGLVYFIEKESSEERVGQIELKAKALYVGNFMQAELFNQCSTVVQTSATLAIKSKGAKDFDHVKSEMGMGEIAGIKEITVPSPFDWHRQSIMVVPDTMPLYPSGSQGEDKSREVEAYETAALEHIVKIINIVKGRTLCLFTSHKTLRKADEYIRERVKYEVFTQGQGTNKDLQDIFRDRIDSVLLGTESFAEGVDIQGEALSCVILDKLSHVPPNDPVLIGLNMRNKRYQKEGRAQMDVFGRYRMPYAITKFKQRTGRLIRSITDVGVMVCLDRRLLEANYSSMFIKSLPPIRVVKNVSEIAPFLRSVGAL